LFWGKCSCVYFYLFSLSQAKAEGATEKLSSLSLLSLNAVDVSINKWEKTTLEKTFSKKDVIILQSISHTRERERTREKK